MLSSARHVQVQEVAQSSGQAAVLSSVVLPSAPVLGSVGPAVSAALPEQVAVLGAGGGLALLACDEHGMLKQAGGLIPSADAGDDATSIALHPQRRSLLVCRGSSVLLLTWR